MAGGRGSKYTPEIHQKIVDAIATGIPKVYAAQMNGITYETLNNWENGQNGIGSKSLGLQFFQDIKRAEAMAVGVRIARITKAAQNGDWKADSWYLEHVHSDVFASRETRDNRISGADGAPLEIVFRRTSKS